MVDRTEKVAQRPCSSLVRQLIDQRECEESSIEERSERLYFCCGECAKVQNLGKLTIVKDEWGGRNSLMMGWKTCGCCGLVVLSNTQEPPR